MLRLVKLAKTMDLLIKLGLFVNLIKHPPALIIVRFKDSMIKSSFRLVFTKGLQKSFMQTVISLVDQQLD